MDIHKMLLLMLLCAVHALGNENQSTQNSADTFLEPHVTPAPRGEKGSVTNDCPLQCRCIALSHLGYRHMAERWRTMGRLNNNGQTIWKATDAPTWREDPNKLNGRDVICMGLDKIPRPLPNGVSKLTLFGDSSSVSDDDNEARLTTIRDTSFMNADTVQHLTISGNNIKILFPFIFKNLPSLQYLALQNNNISHISAASFVNLENLIELRLSDNMIRYLSPSVFSTITKLEFLYLNGNKLAMLSDTLFLKLKQLEYLDLSRNNFRSLSDSVFDPIVNLQELLLNENQFMYVRARWFQNLSKLRNLEIRGNALTRVDPSSFQTMSNLEQLYLSANKINTVSDEAFRNLTKLEVLDIGTNDITNLEPDCFVGLQSLDKLDLSMNRLSFINNKTFTSTPALRILDLSKNLIKDIEEAALHPLAALQELDLSSNKLRKVKSKTFTGLVELKELNLESNVISEVENDAFIVAPLNQLSKITWLSLQYNRIKSLNAYSLFGLPHMKFLNIGHNKLKSIHKKSFYTLTSLQNLLLSNNRLKALEDGSFSSLKNLFSLDLEKNKLTVISDETFFGLKNLDDLNLVSNAIETIADNAFRHFSKLKRLDLRSNLLSEFSFTNLLLGKDLALVDLSKNRIFTLDFPTEHIHNIRQLLLNDNELQSLPNTISNVMAPAGNVWLSSNPWSCDCRLEWIHWYMSIYRIRLLGGRDTVCKEPPSLYGRTLSNLEPRDLKCDNHTVAKMLECQNLQIKITKGGQAESKRSSKQEARKWHVSIRGRNHSVACNGVQLNEDWAIIRRSCALQNLQEDRSQIIVKVGRKAPRDIALSIDTAFNSTAEDFDIRLIRFFPPKRKSDSSNLPCMLTHAQFHRLSRANPVGYITSRKIDEGNGKSSLLTSRAKILPRCDGLGEICLKVSNKIKSENFQGSPLSIKYQGVWYLAGFGKSNDANGGRNIRFTPIWRTTNWLATTIDAVETKCQFQKSRRDSEKSRVLCEDLVVDGNVFYGA